MTLIALFSSMINNAGVSIESTDPKQIWEFSQNAWDKDFAVNANGAFLGCKYAAAQMIKQEPSASGDRGWIVNTSSSFGKVGMSGLAGYVSSKHAVMGLTKAAALDCAPYRVHVNAVCPGGKLILEILNHKTSPIAHQKFVCPN